jgi:hypothetical protein
MPNRYVREACLDSDHYHSVGITGRLAFLELLLNADDFGLVPVHKVFLQRKTTVFAGLSAEAVGAELLSLDQADLIRCYTVGSSPFAYIPRNFFIVRARKPKYPLPDFSALHNRTRFKELAEICAARAIHMHPTSTSTSTSTLSPSGMLDRRPPPCPLRQLADGFNLLCPSCVAHVVDTDARRTRLAARWKQIFRDGAVQSSAEALQFFHDLFKRVEQSRLLTGRVKPASGHTKPFRASLDWLMKPDNFAKLIEGAYDDELSSSKA